MDAELRRSDFEPFLQEHAYWCHDYPDWISTFDDREGTFYTFVPDLSTVDDDTIDEAVSPEYADHLGFIRDVLLEEGTPFVYGPAEQEHLLRGMYTFVRRPTLKDDNGAEALAVEASEQTPYRFVPARFKRGRPTPVEWRDSTDYTLLPGSGDRYV
ncbi:MAG: hypothetical protein ABEI97_02815 [Candidatus Nanohaloarchaea archaeon]